VAAKTQRFTITNRRFTNGSWCVGGNLFDYLMRGLRSGVGSKIASGSKFSVDWLVGLVAGGVVG